MTFGLSNKLDEILIDYSNSLTTLELCNSRKSTVSPSTVLAKQFRKVAIGEGNSIFQRSLRLFKVRL